MYKVFFKDSCFLLTDEQNLLKEGTHQLLHENCSDTKSFICNLRKEKNKFTAVIYGEDVEELFSIFKSCFLYVKAAGGAVQQKNQLLVIKRLGVYDLPKGHQEPHETLEQCAVREVEEECGIQGIQITNHLTDTLHIYFRNGNWFLKKTYWYTMTSPENPALTPQTEEDIEEVFWLATHEINTIKTNTYPSLLEVFEKIQNNSESFL